MQSLKYRSNCCINKLVNLDFIPRVWESTEYEQAGL